MRLRPETKEVAVVIGNSPLERYWAEQMHVALQPFANRVAFKWFNDLSFDEMLKRSAALQPNAAIYFAMLSVDATGVSHEDIQSLKRLHDVASAPIFSYIDAYFGEATVGGSLISVKDLARQSANVAMRILSGEAPNNIKTPPVVAGSPQFDWRELQRWNISESRLPPESEIYFRQLTLWEQYSWQLMGVLGVVLFQAGLIAWLLRERHRRRSAELESRRRFVEMTQMNRSLTVSTMSSSIAHDLNQPLGAILNNAEAAEILLTRNPPDIDQLRDILADIRDDDIRAGEIINHLRGFLKKGDLELHKVDINRVIADVLHIVEPVAAKRGIVIDASGTTQPLPVRAEHVHMQQVLLNLALNGMDAMNDTPNGRKMVFQAVRVADAGIEVSVLDFGSGIPEHKLQDIFESFVTTKRNGTGLGLSIARTIVEMYGGRIWAENRQGGGAAFRFVLPLAESPA